MRILLVSNGHGEDTIATAIGARLADLGADVVAVPLVGEGGAYAWEEIPVAGPRRSMPSGGFALRGVETFLRDLKAGLLADAVASWRAVHRQSRSADACLVVGDVYALGVAWWWGARPRYYVPSAVSVLAWPPDAPTWTEPFGPLERRWMRGSRGVYPRDTTSAEWLRRRGVRQALDLGNPMLDACYGTAPVAVPRPWILLLPGSRADRTFSFPIMLEAMRGIDAPLGHGVVAWVGDDDPPDVHGWRCRRVQEHGLSWSYEHEDGTHVALARGAFGTLVAGADVAVSTSGTAAEQCAGHGIPVVGFATPGPSITKTFVAGQKRALGAALTVVDAAPGAIAEAVEHALTDDAHRDRAARAGRRAMGPPGGAERIADHMWTDLTRYSTEEEVKA